MAPPRAKIHVTSKSPVGDISVVTLIRTDTTLDHSQKAEKVCTTRLCVQRPVFSIYWACVRRCVPAHAWREFGPRRVPKSKAHVSSDNFFAARPPVIWGSFARICAQRAAAAPGGTQGAAQLAEHALRKRMVMGSIPRGLLQRSIWRRGLAARARRGLQHSAAKCARMAMAARRRWHHLPFRAWRRANVAAEYRASCCCARRTLGRSPHKNCKNDLDDQT